MGNSTRNLTSRKWRQQFGAEESARRLTDETIDELMQIADDLAERFYEDRGDYLAGDWIMEAIAEPLTIERIRRGEAREEARVLLEANGHEVGVRELPEPNLAGNQWETSCTCGTPLGAYETREEAAEEARDHAERYHGTVAAEVTS